MIARDMQSNCDSHLGKIYRHVRHQRLAEHPERDYKVPNSEEIELIANNYRTTKHQKTKHDEGKICMYIQEMSPATSTWPTGYRNAS